MKSSTKNDLKAAGQLTFILAVIVIPLLGVCMLSSQIACKETAKLMAVQHKHTFMTGCLIEFKPGHWVPLRQYRIAE